MPLQAQALSTGTERKSYHDKASNWLLDGKASGTISLGLRSIPEGCAVAVTSMYGVFSTIVKLSLNPHRLGQTTICEGPTLRLFVNESFVVLVRLFASPDSPPPLVCSQRLVQPRFVAGPSDYLSIQFKDGRTENIPGPTSIFFNPKDHESVSVHAAISGTITTCPLKSSILTNVW